VADHIDGDARRQDELGGGGGVGFEVSGVGGIEVAQRDRDAVEDLIAAEIETRLALVEQRVGDGKEAGPDAVGRMDRQAASDLERARYR
jgi:hypothetical protein